jgi:hypothetical protein
MGSFLASRVRLGKMDEKRIMKLALEGKAHIVEAITDRRLLERIRGNAYSQQTRSLACGRLGHEWALAREYPVHCANLNNRGIGQYNDPCYGADCSGCPSYCNKTEYQYNCKKCCASLTTNEPIIAKSQ